MSFWCHSLYLFKVGVEINICVLLSSIRAPRSIDLCLMLKQYFYFMHVSRYFREYYTTMGCFTSQAGICPELTSVGRSLTNPWQHYDNTCSDHRPTSDWSTTDAHTAAPQTIDINCPIQGPVSCLNALVDGVRPLFGPTLDVLYEAAAVQNYSIQEANRKTTTSAPASTTRRSRRAQRGKRDVPLTSQGWFSFML